MKSLKTVKNKNTLKDLEYKEKTENHGKKKYTLGT